MLRQLFTAFLAVIVTCLAPAHAQSLDTNFAGREAKIINNAEQFLTLSDFSFRNGYQDRSTKFFTDLKWANVGQKPIIAFEVVMLFYDPFNRQISGPSGRWMITGHDSANWKPLGPGESASDGTIGYGSERAYSGVVYVRAVRFADGTVWYSNQPDIEKQIAVLIPNLKEIGPIDPGAKPPSKP